jgi:regulator of protease activity HflC (stomatin/prohibitin superfamily)
MAEIRRYPMWWHVRATANDHLVLVQRGKTRRSGTGLSFWFRPLRSALSEVPVDDRELPMVFHARTADYQDISVQATIAYRIEDPDVAVRRLDAALDLRTGRWRGRPLDQIAQLLTESAQQHAMRVLIGMPLRGAVETGTVAVRDAIRGGLAAEERLAGTGLRVVDVRVLALRPEPDLERALQTPARELVQQESDRATYERRALAVERERAISENELQSQIELATREEQLVAQRGANERRRATEAVAAKRIEIQAQGERSRLLAGVRAETTRLVGAAEADAEAARMAVYAGLEPHVLLGLALREAASNLPEIGSVTLSPDVVSAALARLAGATGPAGSAGRAAGSAGSAGRAAGSAGSAGGAGSSGPAAATGGNA